MELNLPGLVLLCVPQRCLYRTSASFIFDAITYFSIMKINLKDKCYEDQFER